MYPYQGMDDKSGPRNIFPHCLGHHSKFTHSLEIAATYLVVLTWQTSKGAKFDCSLTFRHVGLVIEEAQCSRLVLFSDLHVRCVIRPICVHFSHP